MGYPDFQAGQTLTAAGLVAMQYSVVDNGADTVVTSSTTLTNTNLAFVGEASATYHYRLLISYNAISTGDLRLAWSAPTNGEVVRFTWGLGDSGSGGTNDYTSVAMRRPATTTDIIVGGSGTSNAHSYHEEGVILGGNGGTFTVQVAQGTSSATSTTVTTSSRLLWLRID